MKRVNKLILVAALAGSVTLMAGTTATLTKSQQDKIQTTIQKTPTVELVPKAVSLVEKASDATRKETAILVVKAVAKKSSVNLASVVGSLSIVAPELAPSLVATVAEVAPDETIDIARVATITASGQAENIISALQNSSLNSMELVKSAVLEEQQAITKIAAELTEGETLSNVGRRFPPLLTIGKFTVRIDRINPRLAFTVLPPVSVNNYASPGADPNR